MTQYTKNERILIDNIKNNKEFKYLIDQPIDNLSINGITRGLYSSYKADPDSTVQYLLDRVISRCHSAPTKSHDPLIPEHITNTVNACVNLYLMIVCADALITKYKTKSINGFSTANTWDAAHSDFTHITFFMDSSDKSLMVRITLFHPVTDLVKPLNEFNTSAECFVDIRNPLSGKSVAVAPAMFNQVPQTIEKLINSIK